MSASTEADALRFATIAQTVTISKHTSDTMAMYMPSAGITYGLPVSAPSKGANCTIKAALLQQAIVMKMKEAMKPPVAPIMMTDSFCMVRSDADVKSDMAAAKSASPVITMKANPAKPRSRYLSMAEFLSRFSSSSLKIDATLSAVLNNLLVSALSLSQFASHDSSDSPETRATASLTT